MSREGRGSVSFGTGGPGLEKRRRMSKEEVDDAIKTGAVPSISGRDEALEISKEGGWEIEALITQMENEIAAEGHKKGFFELSFKNPKHFTWLLVIFASMGGILSGLDQSLISTSMAIQAYTPLRLR